MTWYTGDPVYDTVLTAGLILAVLIAVAARYVDSPYGRFASDAYGFNLGPRLGWFLMEVPATLSFIFFFVMGADQGLVPLIFLVMWLIHYANRGFIFPFLIRAPRGQKSSFSITVVLSGWLVTIMHGYLNATWITDHGSYTSAWLTDPRFIIGFLVYYCGYFLNLHSDAIIRNLRSRAEVEAGEKVYRIPRGGLFRWVSSPSYFSELLAWTGFAICTWSLGSVFILLVSMANLVPRAFKTHAWYRQKFPDYPADRKVLIPFII